MPPPPHKLEELVKSNLAAPIRVDGLEDLIEYPRRAAETEPSLHGLVELHVVDQHLASVVIIKELDEIGDHRARLL